MACLAPKNEGGGWKLPNYDWAMEVEQSGVNTSGKSIFTG